MLKNRKRLRIFLIILTLLVLAFGYVVEQVLPYAGIKPMRRGPKEMSWLLPKGSEPDAYGLNAEALDILSPDQLHLKAWLVSSNIDTTKGIVVVLHGISACKEINYERARMLADLGYGSLLLDLRAHGSSQGDYCTFGFHEKNDLKAVADTLSARFPGKPLGIWGASLGGAIGLQSMAADNRYRFGIIESTFHAFDQVALEYQADWFFGLRSTWLTNHVLSKSGAIAQFDPFSVRPMDAAAQISYPVLFIHGDKDARIPMWFGQENYDACQAPGKRWYKVAGGGHNDLWRKDGKGLRDQITSFLDTL
ncbi:MAG TPA: alpha/beta hydrolase [Saprospiraceae bacterium]|nr:alpha/beta hydrolase [Saprospiraceae bacterium]